MLEVGLAGVSFYGPCSTWRAGHLDQAILLVWPHALHVQHYEMPSRCKMNLRCCLSILLNIGLQENLEIEIHQKRFVSLS